MKLLPPSFLGRAFFGLLDGDKFLAARDAMLDQIQYRHGVFASDNLITWDKALGFLREDAFAHAVNKNTTTGLERGTVWRLSTLVWAARQAAHLDGDFVECACYRGSSARTVADLVDISGRRYFLYDLFEHDESMPHHAMAAHSATLYDEVRARFPEPNVIITKGRVPDSLAQAAPERIAFMHLDLNNAEAEIGALEVLWDRILPGGVLVLDDFGWASYGKQHLAETAWLGARGHHILEMPTGQGLVIKHA
ncbi:TylF/MycF/NovP-related O-methyltransferase [Phenylobacterium sp.]|uniref:TylF/MycF/NovP-related O-methyltransferase n=1 Tax=Phenylobacterium sp. TaxID=1871053 RepID=UPI00286B1608|nr:TylF/MycF/NovP-related O-methyltransferase [Phenylobacterium sp.]